MLLIHEALQVQSTQPAGSLAQVEPERKVLMNKIHQEGFELGVRSTSKLSYKDFQHFERVQALATALDEDAVEYLWTFLDSRGYPQDSRTHDPDFGQLLAVSPDSGVLFAQGWLEGVLSVWQTVKTQVATER
ncbi:MAG TPA: hypothetical protein V6C64_08075 [Microcoleaceae cyanobacterium]|jgi:hypothetical protein